MTNKPKWAPDATPDQIKTFVETCKTIVNDGDCGAIECCNDCPMYPHGRCLKEPTKLAQAYLDYYDAGVNPEEEKED